MAESRPLFELAARRAFIVHVEAMTRCPHENNFSDVRTIHIPPYVCNMQLVFPNPRPPHYTQQAIPAASIPVVSRRRGQWLLTGSQGRFGMPRGRLSRRTMTRQGRAITLKVPTTEAKTLPSLAFLFGNDSGRCRAAWRPDSEPQGHLWFLLPVGYICT